MAISLQTTTAVLGRLLLAAIFVVSPLVNLIPNFGSTVESIRNAGVPFPKFTLTIAIGMLLVGGLLLIAGYKARWGALLLLLFLLVATYYVHAPWRPTEQADAGEQAIHFLKNVGLMGAMLLVIVLGSGPGSLDKERQ
jgi:putative oxidoreductase